MTDSTALRGDTMSLSQDHFVRSRQVLAAQAAAARAERLRLRRLSQADSLAAVERSQRAAAYDLAKSTPPIMYHLTYRDDEGRESVRHVTVRRIDPGRHGLRLSCYCHVAAAPRQFRADRIREVSCLVTGEVFDDAIAYFTNHPMLTEPVDPEGYALAVCKHEVNLLTIVAAADGRFDPDEQEKILIHVYDRMPDLALDEGLLRKRLAKWVPDKAAYDAAMIRMGRFLDGDAVLLMRSMRKLIDVDGHLACEELAFADEIASRLQAALKAS